MRRILMVTTGALGLLFAAPGWTALVSEGCFGGSDNDLTPSAQCAYVYDDGSPNGNANDSESALNGLNLFGQSAWNILGKQEQEGSGFADDPGTTNLINLAVDGNEALNAGTWSFDSGAWSSYDPIALVMKDGNNAPAPPQSASNGFYVYLLEATTSSGIWDTLDTFGGAQLSHMSAYGVRGGVEIPAPGVLGLFGLGLLALFGVSRRR